MSKDILDLFEHLFLAVAGRIVEPDFGGALRLKSSGGGAAPQLQKAKSVIDENASETLLGQAFEVIFREIERYLKIINGFKGVDWGMYVRMRNKERKEETTPQELKNEEGPLLDEVEEESEKKDDEGKDSEKADDETAASKDGEQTEEKKSADGDKSKEEAEKPAEVSKEKKSDEDKADKEEKDEEKEEKPKEDKEDGDDDEDEKGDGDEEATQREEVNTKSKEREERELKQLP